MNKRPYKSYTKSDEENVLNEVVGSRLKTARRNANLTQTKLAKELNISFQQIGKYEKGQNGLNAIRIIQISNLLNIPKSYLLENIELVGEVKQPADSSVYVLPESFNV